MKEDYRVKEDQLPSREAEDGPAIADGDAPLSSDPPNVRAAEPPHAGIAREDDEESAAVEEQRREYEALNDRHLRLAAEFDNYRRRVERERAELFGRAQADLAARLLETLDDLDRVRQHSESATAQVLLEAIQLVERKLRNTLEAAGLESVDAEGAVFDPTSMEAVATVSADSEADDDIVSDVFQPGYRFKGTLVRPARVRVKKYGA